METVTLKTIHLDLIDLKNKVNLLMEYFHEDFLELSDETQKDIEESREQIKAGKFFTLESLEK